MKNSKLLTNDLKYVLFGEIYQRYSDPKARRKAFLILEIAIDCFDQRGFENTTFLMIARQAGLKPPSLRYYFSDLKIIRTTALQYIHLISQKIVIETMSSSENAEAMLKGYLKGHFVWVSNFKSHFRVWLNFLSYSARRKKDRVLNTAAIQNGANRICEILACGRASGTFHHEDDFMSARCIQALILGWLCAIVTEEIEDIEIYSTAMMEQCFKILR